MSKFYLLQLSLVSQSSSMTKITPMILLLIVILAVIFFVFSLVHLLFRWLMENRPFSSVSRRDGILPDAFGSHAFQRQLQHLFRMHDSGLDQAIIEALPVFHYKEIKGLNEPFDCAVCLCEFSDGDRLKLLEDCSHAFHIHCIETWLLSNSTCPLCRGLIGSETQIAANHSLVCHNPIEQLKWNPPDITRENHFPSPAKIFSIRLGKFRNSDDGSVSEDIYQNVVGSSILDGRRCYSMGAFHYIISNAELQVTCSNINEEGSTSKPQKNERLVNNLKIEGKKIDLSSRGDSFSVSKIWLWAKKGNTNDRVTLPIPSRSNLM